jgi:CheY-like chemotaxis protein
LASVLIIDDDSAVRKMLRVMLEGSGYQISEAENGLAALNHPDLASFDLVITDLIMPEQEGIETIREIRNKFPGKKILAMSGFYGAQYLEAARMLGANATLAKPFRQNQLLQEIERLLTA